METREMENIKVPSYASDFGKGKFCAAQPTYQCRDCGACAYIQYPPDLLFGGKCPNGFNGYHNWIKC